MLPNFMLIGPGRAGSDWITKNLRLHPDIFMPRLKATRFFSDGYDKGIEWYSSIFGNRNERAVGEASVGYLHTELAPQRIARHIPNAKLIANLRDPVERSFSSYGRLSAVARPGEPNYDISFEEKIKMSPKLLDQSMYGLHLRRWYDQFPKESILVLTFDEMKSEPEIFLKKIFRFLGVDDTFESPLIHQRLNASATLKSKSRLLYGVYRALLRFNLFTLSRRLDSLNRTPRQSINPATRRRLIDEVFQDDILEVERLTGCDLASWKA